MITPCAAGEHFGWVKPCFPGLLDTVNNTSLIEQPFSRCVASEPRQDSDRRHRPRQSRTPQGLVLGGCHADSITFSCYDFSRGCRDDLGVALRLSFVLFYMTARAPEWEAMSGFVDVLRASHMVSSEPWEMSTRIPRRLRCPYF